VALQVNDADVARVLRQVTAVDEVVFCAKRLVRYPDGTVARGSPGTIARGQSLVRLPGEAKARELRPFELEALVEVALAGAIRFAVLVAPFIGRVTREAPALPILRFESGLCLWPTDAGYPTAAFAGHEG
jgi:hypothetical protein